MQLPSFNAKNCSKDIVKKFHVTSVVNSLIPSFLVSHKSTKMHACGAADARAGILT